LVRSLSNGGLPLRLLPSPWRWHLVGLGRSLSNRGLARRLLPGWWRWHLVGRETLFERVGSFIRCLRPNACVGVKQQRNNRHKRARVTPAGHAGVLRIDFSLNPERTKFR
jgi:hypothetical protein